MPGDNSGKDERLVHQLGYSVPFTFSRSFFSFGFYGLTYSLRARGPYDRSGFFGDPKDLRRGFGPIPTGAVIGNENGFELRVLTSYRTHSGTGITTTLSLSPISVIHRKDWRFTFPSVIGALLPEVGFVLINPKEEGAAYHTELFLRHVPRFQYLFGDDRVVALDFSPFVQLSIPLTEGDKRIEGGFMIGVSAQLPPKG